MTNVDNKEVENFNNLAHNFWDVNGVFKTLHAINPLREQFVLKMAKTLQDKKVLDVGCGGGIFSESLAKQNAKVVAIDKAEAALEVAKLHLLESNLEIDYQNITIEDFANSLTNDDKFDVISCMEMLEHLPDYESAIEACCKATKQNGLLFFSTINRNLLSFAQVIVAAEYLLKLLPKYTHSFNKFLKPSEVASVLRANSCEIISLQGFSYNPLTNKGFLTSNTNVNYMICARKLS